MTTMLHSASIGTRKRHRWSGSEFDRASETGVFDGHRVELINGEILELPEMNDPHAQAVQLATYALLPVFPPTSATVRCQLPMRLGESRPLPDLVVVAGTPRQVAQHPTTALLVIEVSDSTLAFDRGEQADLYASNAIADYWIINVQDRCLEVFRKPVVDAAGIGHYSERLVFAPTQTVSPLAAPQQLIAVADLLP
jgi:Uma2 family endonuclease